MNDRAKRTARQRLSRSPDAAAGCRALYDTYVPPLTFDMVGPGQRYNDVLFTRDAGRVRHVDELR